ncbi:hypothetical protein F2Q68_00044219 [Brassica cretica]|uniref:Transmembrane protein 18 n=1 Tax=Brassica cretica TaxID=69181 RepID=A0A8S9LJM5_BRACR|nr:hypothetical protein F2Q68_00044219 [Brassica cretica]
MEEVRSAMEQQMDVMADLVQKLSGELRTGLQPAYENFIGFFHAIDWKEPWIMGLMAFHALFLLVTLLSRRRLNFHMFLFLFAWARFAVFVLYQGATFDTCALQLQISLPSHLLLGIHNLARLFIFGSVQRFILTSVGGVYFAESLNRLLRKNWKSFSTQNYFDPHGVFLSVIWSGPLLVIAMIILINTLFSLCYLIVKWKRAELRDRARLARSKQE